MPQPFNYLIDVPDPTAKVMEGVKTGVTLKGLQQQRVVDEQTKQLNAALAALGPESPIEDWIDAAKFMDPKKAESLMTLFKAGTEEERANQLQRAQQLLIAAEHNPDTAVDMLNEWAMAYRNSDDIENAQAMDTWAKIFKINPEAAAQGASIMLASLDEEGENALQGVLDYKAEQRLAAPVEADIAATRGEEERAAEMHEYDMATAKAERKKTDAETKKIFAEIEGVGVVTPEQKEKSEDTLKAYHNKRTDAYDKSLRQMSVITSSALDDTGQGDIALVRGFLLMLEPNSVVRESEFATAAESQGMIDKLLMIDDKIKTGEILSKTARRNFVALANKFLKHGKQKAEQEFWHSYDVAKRRELDIKNIFRDKDLTLFTKKGRPDPKKYEFSDTEVQSSIATLDEIIAELGGTDRKLSKSYMQYANPRE